MLPSAMRCAVMGGCEIFQSVTGISALINVHGNFCISAQMKFKKKLWLGMEFM